MNTEKVSVFALSENEAHLNIGQTCLTYLLSDELGKAPPSDAIFDHHDTIIFEETPVHLFSQQSRQYPFCRYAANHWHRHLRGQLEKHEIVQLTHKLFLPQKSNHFLWFSYEIAAYILQRRWRVSFSNTTTLHWAALLSLEEVCSWLIHQGCDINRTSLVGTPLNCALQGLRVLDETSILEDWYAMDFDPSEQTKIAKKLIDTGANIDASPYNNVPLIAIALRCNYSDEILISKLSRDGTAIENSTLEVVQEMLENSDEDEYSTLVTFFSAVSYQNVPESCKERFLELSKRVFTVDLVAAKKSNAEMANMRPEDRLKVFEALFMQAAEHGMESELASLISSIAYLVNEKDFSRILTKCIAVVLENEQDSCLDLLLSHGADPNIPDEDGWTALHIAVKDVNFDFETVVHNVERLLDYGGDFTIRNEKGELPIHLAAANPTHEGLLQKLYPLMENKAPQLPLSILSYSPSILEYAMQSGSDHNVEFLLDKYETEDLAGISSEDGDNLLGISAFRETPLALKLLLGRGLSTDTVNADGTSILYNATASEFKEVFDYLIDIGITDNSSQPTGWNAIHEAANNGAEAKLAALLLAGEDPNVQTVDGSSALHFTMSSTACTQLLCGQEQININLKNNNGSTPLMIYSEGLCKSLFENHHQPTNPQSKSFILNIRHLLSHKADATLVDDNCRTALHYLFLRKWDDLRLVQEDFFDTLRAIVASGGAINAKSRGESPFDHLWEMCVESDRRDNLGHTWLGKNFDLVTKFVINNVPGEFLNELSASGMTPLGFSITQSSMRTADNLLTLQAVNVDERERLRNITPIETAAEIGCTEVIAQALLSRTKTPVHTLNYAHGYSLLHYSVKERKNQTMLKLLLEKKVGNLQLPTRNGQTPLELAILSENPAAVELLVGAGVDIKMSFSKTFYPLHLASRVGFLPVVRTLVELGADVDALLPECDATPLHIAHDSRKAQWSISSYLIDKGANISAIDAQGRTPCLVAACAKRWDIVEENMKSNTHLNETKVIELGLLDFAIIQGQNTIIKKLQQRGLKFSQEIRDKEGRHFCTPLLLAVHSCNEELLNILWNDNVTGFMTDNGWTVAHFSMLSRKNEVRNRLLLYNISWNTSTATPRVRGVFLNELAAIKDLTPQHIAAWTGVDPAITFLHKNKLIANVNAPTLSAHRYSALHLATIFNRLSTVKLLHEYGADLELVDGIDHQTALHHAAKNGFHEIVTALLEAGCKPNEPDIHGMTPELLAIENGHQNVIKILSQHLDALEAKKSASQDKSSDPSVDSPSLSTKNETNSTSSSTYPPDTSISTEATSTIPKRPWRLPLHQGANIRKIMTEDVSIYAINENDCTEELRKMLEENEGRQVESLGKPFRRRL